MSYKDLLVVVDAEPDARQRVTLAASLAKRYGAHLTALYPKVVPGVAGALGFFDPALLDPVYRAAEERSGGGAEAARCHFENVVTRRGLSAEWRDVEGDPTELTIQHGRYADLIVLGQVEPGNAEAMLTRPRLADVALVAGRPALAIPYTGHFEGVGNRVLVAWDGTREASRAVNDAMPLLTAASSVVVVTVDPDQTQAKRDGTPGTDIALHLARHGVRTETQRTFSAGVGIGETLLSRASDLEIDLMVMGAFAHSRAREFLLGGTTRTVLGSMTVPVFMAH